METTGKAETGRAETGRAETGRATQGVDIPRVTGWFAENVPDVVPPLRFDLIAGGHSNLTFSVTDAAGSRWVLRRPPLGHVLATAHDMGREHKIISALGPTDVPVAPAIGLCTDDAVNGAPFYVMGFVPGQVVRDAATASAMPIEARQRAGDSIVDVMANIHAVDTEAVGLGDLGRKDGYIERQLNRWRGQWEKSKTRELPIVEDVYETLLARIPAQVGTAIVHGDYRLDNCMLALDGSIAAVLDWEICTLGDALADVGLLMVYWNDPDDAQSALATTPTAVEGFPTRAELLERYAKVSGRDLSAIDFYVAFGYWKLACIVEGVYARYVGGAMGDAASGFEYFGKQVEQLATSARDAAQRLK